jgi:hypothetical protein
MSALVDVSRRTGGACAASGFELRAIGYDPTIPHGENVVARVDRR